MTQVSMVDLVAGVHSGRLASFPTDTVPALAVRPDRADLIFTAKQRRQDKPLILMGAKSADLWPFVTGRLDERLVWQRVAASYWPGALTLVLPASAQVPRVMNPIDSTTIGIRVPDCAIARSILSQTGPLATSSANFSGQQPLLEMAEIAAQFPDVLTLSLAELEPCQSLIGVPSTVVKWNGSSWDTLRQGAVTINSI